VGRIASALVGIVVPPLCAACGAPCDADAPVCERCSAAVARLSPLSATVPGIGPVWAAAPYEGVARELVGALKFRGRIRVAGLMAGRMGDPPGGFPAGTLVPVPPAPARLRARGFDPAAESARALASLTGVPAAACLRRADGPRQVGRERAERLADPPRVHPVRGVPDAAVLVDDVLTTGATLRACAAALRRAGCENVAALVFARSV
jgi:predicted amidophosphoribosyltransferase